MVESFSSKVSSSSQQCFSFNSLSEGRFCRPGKISFVPGSKSQSSLSKMLIHLSSSLSNWRWLPSSFIAKGCCEAAMPQVSPLPTQNFVSLLEPLLQNICEHQMMIHQKEKTLYQAIVPNL
ncbi:hypothetical protein M5K25_001033 [Dendrobium thyrsiflorum]|uniref:Uncharacterized protein n=1 Tax=Dendrobium thyrsiflorum TaxID=117978 RepID=A0ABD0VYH8_DENTH